jgi:hypothetical protein
VIWDNRCALHSATGGYPIEEQRIHWRVTIMQDAASCKERREATRPPALPPRRGVQWHRARGVAAGADDLSAGQWWGAAGVHAGPASTPSAAAAERRGARNHGSSPRFGSPSLAFGESYFPSASAERSVGRVAAVRQSDRFL